MFQTKNSNSIKYNNSTEYKNLLKDIQDLTEINNDISKLLSDQSEQISNIEINNDITIENLSESNKNLETASKYNLRFKPILIGGIVGASLLTPAGILLGAKGATLYLAGSGGVLGSILCKKLS